MFNKTTIKKDQPEYALILNGPVYPPVVQCLIYAMTAGAFAIFLRRKSIRRFFCHVCGGTDPDNIVRIYRNKNESHFF